ncbi:DedA family protein [Lyngbya confervoides]|uniref:VTT domain-containing protein n=1 Tax=Lyngbya confervoides BDU141951 TaxID=1574623 RepID=A0ABD4T3A2_9CYAN|nr:VTT domain-containing protein [Lyngbya confervoides]MCM1983054.1 VTT domain-containing protein [Lyngbya confervoides BDU141951]
MHSDLAALIQSIGYLGVWAIIFAESGLLIGFFLPGDSLLFTAGFLGSQHLLNLWILTVGAALSAVLGDNVGYATGHRFGRRLFHREDSRFFHRKHLIKAQRFYDRHGGKAIILARFMPLVRTFAPITAGIGKMRYSTFMTYNLVGGILWTVGLTLLGFFLGHAIPDIEHYLLPILAILVILSAAPSLIHLWRDRIRDEQGKR